MHQASNKADPRQNQPMKAKTNTIIFLLQEQEDAENEFAHDYGANRLLAAKRARKRAEGDYQLLQNRLVRLRVSQNRYNSI